MEDPDIQEILRNGPLLCAFATSAAEQMIELYNWWIGIGVRRDLRSIRLRKPYRDKDLANAQLEQPPAWCAVVDREVDGDIARCMLESKAIDLSPSFKKRDLASSQFMCFSWRLTQLYIIELSPSRFKLKNLFATSAVLSSVEKRNPGWLFQMEAQNFDCFQIQW